MVSIRSPHFSKNLVKRSEIDKSFPAPDSNIIKDFQNEDVYLWNSILSKFLGVVANCIANLEHADASVDKILINFLFIDWKWRHFIVDEKYITADDGAYLLGFISQRIYPYSVHRVFLISLFFNPLFKPVALSSKLFSFSSFEQVRKEVFQLLTDCQWHQELYIQEEIAGLNKELKRYYEEIVTQDVPDDHWSKFPLLKRLIIKINSIKAHTALAEGTFSQIN